MRVLILMPRAPYPADHGTALRNFHILKWLGARHEVALFAFGDPTNAHASDRLGEHAASIDILPFPRRSRLARLHDLVVSDQPDLTRRLWSAELVARLSNVLSLRHSLPSLTFPFWRLSLTPVAPKRKKVYQGSMS